MVEVTRIPARDGGHCRGRGESEVLRPHWPMELKRLGHFYTTESPVKRFDPSKGCEGAEAVLTYADENTSSSLVTPPDDVHHNPPS